MHIFDVSSVIANPSPTTDLEGAKETYLSVDDVVDLTTGEISIAPWKWPIAAGSEVNPNAISSNDIFSTAAKPNGGGEWRKVAKHLVDTLVEQKATSVSSEKSPSEFQVVIDRSEAQSYKGNSPYGQGVIYNWTGMSISIRGL